MNTQKKSGGLGRILKVIGIGIAGCLVLGVVASITNPNRGSSPSSPSTSVSKQNVATPTAVIAVTILGQPTEVPTQVQTPAVTLTPKEALQAVAQNVCGKDFVESEFNDLGSQTPVALVRCKLKDNFSNNLIVAGALMDFESLVKQTMPRSEFKIMRFILIGQFKDAYGKESELPAFGFTMTRELYDKIQWDNVTRQDVGKLLQNEADGSSATVHPAWREDWAAYLAS